MKITIKGGVEVRPNGHQGVTVILDCELRDILDQCKDRDIFDCLDAETVAAYFGLVKPS